ncbi:MAG TPA: ABC transporter substrate-binding protein [Candidatus Acidoferrales bacterium]|nr:ABC transporter substrate-binding protein [Candidatus Acidoferrales bacterium]
MTIGRLVAISFGLLCFVANSSIQAADKVVVSYSSRSYAFLPAQVAVARGFFRDENLEPLLIQMRSQVTVPALMSGEVHFTLSFGNIIGSAMQGMPFKIIAVLTDKPLHSLVARPEIKTINDLRGKRVGTQRIGGSDHLAAEAILQAKGVDLKDVQFVTLGGDEPVRMEILKKGLVDAICTVPPGPVRLAREGYNILGGPKDLKIGSPISAVAVTDARLQNNREETKRVLRAVLRGLRFMHERKEETIQIMSQWLSQTTDVARDSYDSILPSFSADGSTVDKTFEFAIDARKSTVKADKPIPLSQVRDVSLLREVQKELRLR